MSATSCCPLWDRDLANVAGVMIWESDQNHSKAGKGIFKFICAFPEELHGSYFASHPPFLSLSSLLYSSEFLSHILDV